MYQTFYYTPHYIYSISTIILFLITLSITLFIGVSLSPKFSFQLDKRGLTTIHLNAITRLYGEHGNEILDLLRKNPVG